MNKEQIFRKLYENRVKRNKWYDKLPHDIAMAFVDNEYADLLERDHDMLLNAVFGDDVDSITWFLYEWQENFEVGYDDVVEQIRDIDHYIQWLEEHEPTALKDDH